MNCAEKLSEPTIFFNLYTVSLTKYNDELCQKVYVGLIERCQQNDPGPFECIKYDSQRHITEIIKSTDSTGPDKPVLVCCADWRLRFLQNLIDCNGNNRKQIWPDRIELLLFLFIAIFKEIEATTQENSQQRHILN